MYERFTQSARFVMYAAGRVARHQHRTQVRCDDVLFALILQSESVAARVLKSFGVDSQLFGIVNQVDLQEIKGKDERRTVLVKDVKKLIESSMLECLSLRHSYVGTGHLLLGLCKTHPNNATDFLQEKSNINPVQLFDECMNVIADRAEE